MATDPFADPGRAKSYFRNNRVTNLDEVGEALNFGVFHTLIDGQDSLTPEERFALMIWVGVGMMATFVLWSLLCSPRAQRRRLLAQQKQDRLRRPWRVLSLFHGSLFVVGHKKRPPPSKETKLGLLHSLAGKSDLYTQCEAVSALCHVSEMLQKKMPGVVAQDLSLMLLWGSSPAPAVSQRIPLMVAVLAYNSFNRERLSVVGGAMKALVAAARAASKLKQLHALLAMATCSRNRELAKQLVKLGVVDVLAAIIASKEPGARPRLKQEVPKDGRLILAAASALAQIAEWEEHRRHCGKLAFLRSVISLTRSADIRIQLAGVTILALLAQGGGGGVDLRTAILDAGALVAMIPLSTNRSAAVQAQACRVLLSLVGGYGQGWAKRLRGICTSADDAHSEQVWVLRKQRVWANTPPMMQKLDYLASTGCLNFKDVREALSALSGVIDGQYYDPTSKLEELEELEGLEEQEEATYDETDLSRGKDLEAEEGGEEEEEEEEEEDFVSATNSPQVSAPSSPRGEGGAVECGLSKDASQEEDGEAASRGAKPPRKGAKGKAWQKVKTTWVDTSPSSSPDASPASSPACGDGAGKDLGQLGGATAPSTRGWEAEESDDGDASEDSDASSDASSLRSAPSRSTSRSGSAASAVTTKPSSPRSLVHKLPRDPEAGHGARGANESEMEADDGDAEVETYKTGVEHGGPEHWGREYSSLTHRCILEGFAGLQESGNQDEVSAEAMSLVRLEVCLMVLEQTHSQLPVLLQELRRHYHVDDVTEVVLSPKQLDEMNDRGMSISRPLESILTILRQVKREIVDLSRIVNTSHKARSRSSRPPWDFYDQFPMFCHSQDSLAANASLPADAGEQAVAGAERSSGDANLASGQAREGFEWDETLSVTLQLRSFLSEYHTSYVTERSLVAQSQLLPRSGKRPEVMMNRQFVRDVPSLLRLNGAPPPGESPEDKVRYVYDAIVKAVDGNTEKAQRITIVCNQNLGVFLYEKLVLRYAEQANFLVMQTGEHALDLRTMRRGVVAVFESVFRLSPAESVTENEGDLIKAMVKVDFVHKNVSYKFSKPLPNK